MRAQYSIIIAMVLLTILVVSSMYYLRASTVLHHVTVSHIHRETIDYSELSSLFRSVVWEALRAASRTGNESAGLSVLENWATLMLNQGYIVSYNYIDIDVVSATNHGHAYVNASACIRLPDGYTMNISHKAGIYLDYVAIRYGFWWFWYYIAYISLTIEDDNTSISLPVTPDNSNIYSSNVAILGYTDSLTTIRFRYRRYPPNPLIVEVYGVKASAYL